MHTASKYWTWMVIINAKLYMCVTLSWCLSHCGNWASGNLHLAIQKAIRALDGLVTVVTVLPIMIISSRFVANPMHGAPINGYR